MGVAVGAGEEDVVARRRDAGLHGRRENRGRDPSIMTHDDRARLAFAGIGRGELDDHRRVEPIAHDAAKSRDAGDPCTAIRSPRWPLCGSRAHGDSRSIRFNSLSTGPSARSLT